MTIKEAIETLEANYPEACLEQLRDAIDVAISALKQAERPTAHWKAHEDGSGTCTACHFTQKAVWDMDSWQEYCGKCGAKMEGMGISPWPEVRK